MSRSLLAALAAVALIGAVGLLIMEPPAPPPVSDGPNVLMIVWDTTRADRLSLYGYDKPTTPRLEAFARDAVVFDRAISPAMWTPPSHASMFTGYAPTHHGVEASNKWLDARHVTLAEWLGQHGWDTYAFSANPYVAKETNLTQGFDEVNNAFKGRWKDEARKATKAKLIPEDASSDISPRWRKVEGQGASGVAHAYKDAAPVAHEALLEWLGARKDPARPWFAFLNMMETHIPRVPSMASRRKVMTDAQIDLSLKTDVAQINLLAHTFGKKLYTPDEIDAINGVYDAAIADMDDATGDLLDDLRSRGMLDDTVVILIGDHGENLGDHGMFGHKYNVYDTLLHVPLVISWPGHLAPRRVAFPVSTLNLFTTVLSLVGLDAPDTSPESHGSLLDLAAAEPVFSELNETTPISIQRVAATYGLSDASRYIRTFKAVEVDGFKFIEASDDAHELYRMPDDADEANNLYAAEPARAAQLQALIDDWVRSVKVYDPSLKSSADQHVELHDASKAKKSLEAQQEEADRLRALGYLDDPEADAP
ncbi:MAG TPA: sulfatase [Myxococcota bacterium]|nr:sulfatase [Myxococcota bacterium]